MSEARAALRAGRWRFATRRPTRRPKSALGRSAKAALGRRASLDFGLKTGERGRNRRDVSYLWKGLLPVSRRSKKVHRVPRFPVYLRDLMPQALKRRRGHDNLLRNMGHVYRVDIFSLDPPRREAYKFAAGRFRDEVSQKGARHNHEYRRENPETRCLSPAPSPLVHACRPTVCLDTFKASPQVGQRVHLVNQPEPLASSHSLFESRQHPFRPNRRFHPVPAGSNPRRRLRFSGLLSRFRHCRRSCFRGLLRHVSTFLRPFAPGPLQALLHSYGRSDSCAPGSSAFLRHELRLLHAQVSLIHAPGLPTIPSPTTCGCSASSGHVTPRRVEPRLLPHGVSPNGNSGLRHSLAGSPHRTGRIEFLSVRTGRSPPAAPHPVSPRRSCRPITSYVDLERTFTPPTRCALRRTSADLEVGTCRAQARRYDHT